MNTLFHGIENIIFDFGGVILNINPQFSVDAFSNLGIANIGETYAEIEKLGLFENLEKGKISNSDFRNEIRNLAKKNLSDNDIDNAWCAMLLDYPKERIDLLFKLQKQFRIFLLSNTNSIHWKHYASQLEKDHEITFEDIFEKAYFSHQMEERKPGSKIYQIVLNENNLNPENTLFIDDSLPNIEGAKKVGLKTHFLKPHETINQLFGF